MDLSRRTALMSVGASSGMMHLPSSSERFRLNRRRLRTGTLVPAPRSRADLELWRRDVDILRSHGNNLLRLAVPSWLLAPAPGDWSLPWERLYREALTYARDRHCVINVVVPGAPDWAQPYSYRRYVASCKWFWSQMEEAFGDQVDVWQVFNEADSLHYRHFTPAELSHTYLHELEHLLDSARTIFRSVTTTNLTGWPMNDEREDAWVYVLDRLESALDMVSLNVYPADNPLEIERLPDRLHRIRRRYGKRLFVAELGLQTVPGTWDEAAQGLYLARTIDALRPDALWGICMYELRDQPSPAGFGLLHADGSPKSGFDDVMMALRALRRRARDA